MINALNAVNFSYSLIPFLISKFGLGGSVWTPVLTVLGVVLCIVVPYLLGSINFAIILSRKMNNDDVRKHGSGNAGATNMLRTYGKRAAIMTIGGDMLKAAISVLFGQLIFGNIGGAVASFFVVFGHMFPIFFKFRGGKGVASAAMAILVLSPPTFLFMLAIFIIIVAGTKYVSLGSTMAALLYPLLIDRMDRIFSVSEGKGTRFIFALLTCIFVIFMHRENLKRIYNGNESKISLGKSKKEKSKGEK